MPEPTAGPPEGPLASYFDPFGFLLETSYVSDDTGLYSSVTFGNLKFSFVPGDQTYTASRVVSFGVTLPIPFDFRLAGYRATLSGFVQLEYGTQASVFLSFGGAVWGQDWPLTAAPAAPGDATATDGGSTSVDPDRDANSDEDSMDMADEEFVVSCFSPDVNPRLGTEDPPFPTLPPVPVTIGLHARRSDVQRSGFVRLESLELRPLMDPDPRPPRRDS